MDEVYVSARENSALSSDNVFYTEHVDGPWGFVPGATVYRCLAGLSPNPSVATVCPLAGTRDVVGEHELLGFDYHRELHLIEPTGQSASEPRVTLKLHFAVYAHPSLAQLQTMLAAGCTATSVGEALVEIKGITRSLLPETFESYSRAEARADELNRQERVMALRAFA